MATHIGSDANETIPGSTGDDSLFGSGGSDKISGLGGNDSLHGGDGEDQIEGGTGDDSLNGGNGIDLAYYFQALGPVVVHLGNGTATGADGNDTLAAIEGVYGSFFADAITGNAGDNYVQGLDGDDTLEGGGGFDVLAYYDATGGVNISLVTGTTTGAAGNDSFSGFEWYVGSNVGNDTMTGDAGANSLQGWGGSDLISGGDGDDTLEGGEGNDTIFADGGQDVVIGGLGNDALNGGAHVPALGSDWVSYEFAAGAVNVNLATGLATGADGTDTLAAFERIRGSAFNDTLTGDGADNILRGNGGDDLIDGGGGLDSADYNGITGSVGVFASLETGVVAGPDGSDTLLNIENLRGSKNADALTGNVGNNNLRGNAGNDTLDGGGGFDNVQYYNAAGPVTVNLDAGTASGADGNDVLFNFEGADGSFLFGDILQGNAGANQLRGLGGNDSLAGGGGQDTLYGGAGNDTLDGGTITDRVSYTDLNFANYSDASSGVVVNLSGITGTGETGQGTASDGDGGTDVLAHINFVNGSGFNDSITGSAALIFEQFDGGLGNDTLNGGAIDAAGVAANRASYTGANGAVVIDLAAGTVSGAAGNDTLVNINYVRGSTHGDTITGAASTWTEQLDGREGNDSILGAGGRDSLIGGAGNDTLDGGAVTDRANYTDLNFVTYAASTGAVMVNLSGITGDGSSGSGTATDGFGGTDTLMNVNFVIGSQLGDVLTGSSALIFEEFTGLGGNDTIDGGAIDPASQSNGNRASYAAATSSIAVNLADGTATGGGVGSDTLININHVRGSAHADSIVGSDSVFAEHLEGAAGNDTLDGRGGIDIVRYDSATAAVNVNLITGVALDGLGGSDTLVNIEGIRGSSFSDTLTGGNPDNDGGELFFGLAGNDTINGGSGVDRSDYIASPAAVVVTLGGTGNGTASDGYGGTDLLIGIEQVRGSDFHDHLIGSNTTIGYESFEGRAGNDTIDGMGGTDRADYNSGTSAVIVDLAQGLAHDSYGGLDVLLHIENARGTYYDDTLRGDANDNLLQGQAGNDSIQGAGGNDTIAGGAGDDILDGGGSSSGDTDWLDYGSALSAVNVDLHAGTATSEDGSDTVSGFEAVSGSSHADILTGDETANRLRGNLGDDTLDGGAGMDTADYRHATGAVSVNLVLEGSSGADGNDTLLGINIVLGSDHDDELTGDETDNALDGGGGNDVLDGGDGHDTLTGGLGDDTLHGGSGDDVAVYAGDIADYTIATDVETGDLIVSGPEGADRLFDIERLRFANQDFILILGSVDADDLNGGVEGELISAGGGADTVNAGDGDDAAYGEAGDDSINAGEGDDVVDGGTGVDTLVGGIGNDTYFVDADGDQVVETEGAAFGSLAAGIGGGIDKVVAGISYTLGGFVENLTLAFGSAGLTGTGNELDNDVVGNELANSLAGLGGSDSLTGGAGDDQLDGGTGTDYAYFSGTRSQYFVSNTGSGWHVEDTVAARDGTDAVANVEFLRFADRYVDLGLPALAGQVSPATLKTMQELYVGFFNRIPESDGMRYWIGELLGGRDLSYVAGEFYAAGVAFGVYSAQFTDSQFVAQVYDYVLARGPASPNAPSAGEIDFWADQLTAGTTTEGALVLKMLGDVHTFFEDLPPEDPFYEFNFVADLLNNKAAVADYYAVQQGLAMYLPADNISFGSQLAAAITPDSTAAALALIGVPELP